MLTDRKAKKQRKCPVCKGKPRGFKCSENLVGSYECGFCQGTGFLNTPDSNRGQPPKLSAVHSLASAGWLDDLEAALCKVNEAEGCLLIRRRVRAMKLIYEAKEILEKLVGARPSRSSNRDSDA